MKSKASAQFERCAWCNSDLGGDNYGRYLGTVGALFMGEPACICKACVEAEKAELRG